MTLKGDRGGVVSCPSDFLALLSQVVARVPQLSHFFLAYSKGLHPGRRDKVTRLRLRQSLGSCSSLTGLGEKENKMNVFMMSVAGPRVPFMGYLLAFLFHFILI